MCTSKECPIDKYSQLLWMASVIVPPTPLNQTINYDVLGVVIVNNISMVSEHLYSSFHEDSRQPDLP